MKMVVLWSCKTQHIASNSRPNNSMTNTDEADTKATVFRSNEKYDLYTSTHTRGEDGDEESIDDAENKCSDCEQIHVLQHGTSNFEKNLTNPTNNPNTLKILEKAPNSLKSSKSPKSLKSLIGPRNH